jgi:hypothetical protein
MKAETKLYHGAAYFTDTSCAIEADVRGISTNWRDSPAEQNISIGSKSSAMSV